MQFYSVFIYCSQLNIGLTQMNFFSFANKNKKKRNFINPELISRHLYCCICQDVFSDAVRTQCGHTFCYICIQQWANLKKHCPVCKQGFGNRELEKDLIANKMIDDLEIRCMHMGCDWQGVQSLRNKHQRFCTYKQKNDRPQQLNRPMTLEITDVDFVQQAYSFMQCQPPKQ